METSPKKSKVGFISKEVSVYLTLMFICCYCNICGELPYNLQHKVDVANAKFSKYVKLQHIPCEMIYFNVILKDEQCDTAMIHELHKILYDEEKRDGWLSLVIHDGSGRYLFTHGKSGNIYLELSD